MDERQSPLSHRSFVLHSACAALQAVLALMGDEDAELERTTKGALLQLQRALAVPDPARSRRDNRRRISDGDSAR